MEWIYYGDTNSGLVRELYESRVFRSEKVRDVMTSVDRADFTNIDPYFDSPQSIGYGATISAPHMHAMALEGLVDVIRPDSHILDIGSGSGYLTTCFAKLIGPNGVVVGIEHIKELVELSKRNVGKHHADLLNNGQIKFVVGDGREGYKPESPYDAIHVGAAATKVPQALIDQLAVGGRMLIPVGQFNQEFMYIEKLENGKIRKQKITDVMYVPLTDPEVQLR